MTSYLRYRDDLEQTDADEAATIESIITTMASGQRDVAAKEKQTVRISHAKPHAFARGTLTVLPGLPPELAQGLFAQGGTHDVVVRMSQAPGETLDDRAVSSARGFAVKVFGVEGPKLAGHEGATTQDFVFDTGKVFVNSNMKSFLATFTPNVKLAPKLPEAVKGAVSKVAGVANAAMNAVGVDAPKLDVFGHPTFHPLAEAYYSQIALRYGDYVAKIAFVPANPALDALRDIHVNMSDANALALATRSFFSSNDAVYDVKVQLATDETRMPVEDPMVEWPEDESPYRTVARLLLPRHAADASREAVGEDLSFSPAHALAAHRPLGSIGRARVAVYPVISTSRRRANGRPTTEPATLADVERGLPRPLARVTTSSLDRESDMRAMTTRKFANGLGWFSLGLGVTEVLAAEPLARALGIKSSALVRVFGAREIAAGLGILLRDRKAAGVWSRIAGDGLDLAVLGWALRPSNRQRGNAALALAAVAPVVALDLLCGARLSSR